MVVGKDKALARQPIDMFRLDPAVRIDGPDIAVPHVVREADQDVWPAVFARFSANRFLRDSRCQNEVPADVRTE